MIPPLTVLQGGGAVKSARRLALLSLDLGYLFERIIRSWGADRVEHLERPFDTKADLPMERMALLSGTLKGMVVLRSSREFPAWLQRQRVGLIPVGCSGTEAFEELLTLFALYLFHDFWTPDSFTVGPIHPFPSIPLDWPSEAPTAARGLVVEGFKVEIRLWKTA
jgi:hypothetical protein